MAYRVLVAGDKVKIRKSGHDDHGSFGVVEGIVCNMAGEQIDVRVRFSSWRNTPVTIGLFKPSELLLSTGNPYQMCLSQEDEDSLFHDESEMTDAEIMQDLLQRVSKLEKEILDMKSQRV